MLDNMGNILPRKHSQKIFIVTKERMQTHKYQMKSCKKFKNILMTSHTFYIDVYSSNDIKIQKFKIFRR